MADAGRRLRRATVAIAIVVLVAAAGCSGDVGSAAPGAPDGPPTTTATSAHPAVDVAGVVLRPPPAGKGVPQASASVHPDYTETELLLSGSASTYTGPATGPVEEGSTRTPYVTRILVRYPTDPGHFSGRTVVEPFNTSGGADLDVIWAQASDLLQADGDAWIGVTERSSSVEQLQTFDAVRYAGLLLPSNDLAWDILRQVGALVKGPEDTSPLPGLSVQHVYLAGFSQSGIDSATFALAFNGRTRMDDGSALYDGYLPAGHSGSLTPVQPGTGALPTFEHLPMSAVDVPVIDLETQTDVEGFEAPITPTQNYQSPGQGALRREDSDSPDDLYRLYEIAGAPHVASVPGCDGGGSSFPTPTFVRAALVRLFGWAEDGTAPPKAPRIDLATTDVVSQAKVDQDGNAVGGVRSPFLDVPLAHYEAHSTPGALCKLSGRETELPAATLAQRYGDANSYQQRFDASLDVSIRDGYLLQQDRETLVTAATAQARATFAAQG